MRQQTRMKSRHRLYSSRNVVKLVQDGERNDRVSELASQGEGGRGGEEAVRLRPQRRLRVTLSAGWRADGPRTARARRARTRRGKEEEERRTKSARVVGRFGETRTAFHFDERRLIFLNPLLLMIFYLGCVTFKPDAYLDPFIMGRLFKKPFINGAELDRVEPDEVSTPEVGDVVLERAVVVLHWPLASERSFLVGRVRVPSTVSRTSLSFPFVVLTMRSNMASVSY